VDPAVPKLWLERPPAAAAEQRGQERGREKEGERSATKHGCSGRSAGASWRNRRKAAGSRSATALPVYHLSRGGRADGPPPVMGRSGSGGSHMASDESASRADGDDPGSARWLHDEMVDALKSSGVLTSHAI